VTPPQTDSTAASAPVEALGTVTCPTGDLLLLDFGLLRLWSGAAPPLLPEHVTAPDVVKQANAAADFEIVGADAAAVAAALDLAAVKGRFGFDLPADGEFLAERVATVCSERRLDAHVRRIERMPHRERVSRLLDDQPGGAEVLFNGSWAVAIRGVPTDRPLQVRGQRMDPSGPHAARWHSVWVELDDRPIASSVEAGYVLVDEARLMFADPEALNEWENDVSFDGLADLVFWGRDEDEVADRVGASVVESAYGRDIYGWLDRPAGEIGGLLRRLDEVRESSGLWVAVDVRPHDHHRQLLARAARSPTQSGTIEVGGAAVTGFFTTWGDGAFPVLRDLTADGSLCRVRVELGTAQTVARADRSEHLWFGPLSKLAIASARVVRDGAPVGWMHRQLPDNDSDSGWRVFSGDETQQYLDDAANAVVIPLRDLVQADAALEPLLDVPSPAAFERSPSGDFVPCPPPDIE
jgi:hypothetical protein